MTKVEALKELYTAIGGSEDLSDAQTIVDVLNAISTLYAGGKSETIAEAIAKIAAVIDVPVQPVLTTKTATANGTYSASEDDADGYSSVTVEVSPTLENKTVTPTTSEQTVTAGENYDGLGAVTVEAVTSAIDSNITAENIKDGVSILGVEGNVSAVEFSATPEPFSLFTNIRNLNVVIPNGVTRMEDSAFYFCVGLTSVEIPSSLIAISSGAFQRCTGLTSVEIPCSVIGDEAFDSCTGLTSVELSNSVTSIGAAAFAGCTGLTSIEIPSSVTSIGEYAFADCTNLTTITVHKAEGSITGAPWGAPNATVVWDGE